MRKNETIMVADESYGILSEYESIADPNSYITVAGATILLRQASLGMWTIPEAFDTSSWHVLDLESDDV